MKLVLLGLFVSGSLFAAGTPPVKFFCNVTKLHNDTFFDTALQGPDGDSDYNIVNADISSRKKRFIQIGQLQFPRGKFTNVYEIIERPHSFFITGDDNLVRLRLWVDKNNRKKAQGKLDFVDEQGTVNALASLRCRVRKG